MINISVITPVYNAGNFLEACIDSALSLSEVQEIILIEDGSTDNALNICKKLEAKHQQVRLLQHPDQKNHGAGASRNLGLTKATSPYIAFLDADDRFLSNRFEAEKDIFRNIPEAEGVYNALGVHYYSCEAKEHFQDSNLNDLTTMSQIVEPHNLFSHLICYWEWLGYFSLDTLTIKREILSRMNYWFNPWLRLHQDTEFIYRLSYYARLYAGNLKHPVALRGVHDGNRIMGVKKDPKAVALNQKKLSNSFYRWARENKIEKEYYIHLLYGSIKNSRSYDGYLKTLIRFLWHSIRCPKLFLDSRYYNPMHRYFWGSNRLSELLLRIKNRVQKTFI